MDQRTRKLLLELTSLPTAAGGEHRVIGFVERWAKRRRGVTLRRDRFGNVLLQRRGLRGGASPIVFEAHMDHPAFVVYAVSGRQIGAAFRGGVKASYFKGSAVCLAREGQPPRYGRVVRLIEPQARRGRRSAMREARPDLCAMIDFDEDPHAQPGDVLTWALDPAQARDGRLWAPACDNLAGVAAGLTAFDRLLRSRAKRRPDVRVLLTRAEEVGFIGAMAACRSGIIPRSSRLIVLENSRSFADSPIGAGPIVRVGDKTSTFDPDLTYRLSRVAEQLATQDKSFAWQRKLMPGGTCEASAFGAFGYRAACLCLPLGNYHNMNEQTQRIDRETIALADFDALVKLLVETARRLDAPDGAPPLRQRLDDLFARRRALLD